MVTKYHGSFIWICVEKENAFWDFPNFKDLSNIIKENVVPEFHVFGHIHEDYGIWKDEKTTFINAAFAGPWKGYPAHSWTNKTAIVFDVLIPKELK